MRGKRRSPLRENHRPERKRHAFEMDEKSGPMMFSALPYTPHELENAKHPYELPQVHYTVVRAALGQMGIAGDDSWMSFTHPEYPFKCRKQNGIYIPFPRNLRQEAGPC